MKLRDYQIKAIADTESALQEKRSVMVQSPTGSGKSVILGQLIQNHINKPSDNPKKPHRVLFCVDRVELVMQIVHSLWKRDIYVGIIMGNQMPDYSAKVQVASIATLNRRSKPEADLIIIDEAHATPSESYRKLWELYPDAKFCGFTATPIRLSGNGFTDLFDCLVQTLSIKDLIDKGYLVPIKHYICSVPEFSEIEMKNGEYDEVSSFNQLKTAPIIESYEEHCKGMRGIVFATNVEHSKMIEAQYNAIGVRCKHLDSNTPEHERNKSIELFRKGEIQILTNVALFITGFDVPNVEFVQLVRLTKSLSYYLQMVGRGTRPLTGVIDNAQTDEERVACIAKSAKPNCIILDHAGLFYEHGLATHDHNWQYYFERKKVRGSKKIDQDSKWVAGEDDQGKIHFTHIPSELKGMRLVEVTSEMLLFKEFDKMLNTAIFMDHKLISSFIKFQDMMTNKKLSWTDKLFEMVSKRLLEANKSTLVPADKRFNPSNLYFRKKEIFDGAKKNSN